jgi:hypothetical protein
MYLNRRLSLPEIEIERSLTAYTKPTKLYHMASKDSDIFNNKSATLLEC